MNEPEWRPRGASRLRQWPDRVDHAHPGRVDEHDLVANNPEAKLYKFTRVDDQVVLVDPTKMRVIAVIGPKPKE